MTAGLSAKLAGSRREQNVAAARQVACPTCRAQPGQPCTGRSMRGPDACHTTRIKAAKPSKESAPPWPFPEFALLLLCEHCGEEITWHQDGYATVNHRAAFMRGRALQEWRRAHPGEDTRRGPARVSWRLLHQACDDDRRDDDLRIDTRRLRSALQLMRLSVQLTGKQWVPNTDFAALVGHIMRASATPQPEAAALAKLRAEVVAKHAVPQEHRDG